MTDIAEPRHRAYLEKTLGAHAAYKLHYYLVWSVKMRRPVLTGPVAAALGAELARIADAIGVTILALHSEPEHVHLLVSLRPDMAVATVVGRFKGATARHLRAAFPDVCALDARSLWNDGYFARTIGDVNVAQAKAYLDGQKEHHGT